MRELKIMDYDGNLKATGVDMDDTHIEKITVKILSGDEIAIVTMKNNEEKIFDASEDRHMDFYDGSFVLLDKTKNIDRRTEWEERTESYDMLYNLKKIKEKKYENKKYTGDKNSKKAL